MRSRGTYNENLAGFPEIDYLGYQGYSSPIVSLSTGRKDNWKPNNIENTNPYLIILNCLFHIHYELHLIS